MWCFVLFFVLAESITPTCSPQQHFAKNARDYLLAPVSQYLFQYYVRGYEPEHLACPTCSCEDLGVDNGLNVFYVLVRLYSHGWINLGFIPVTTKLTAYTDLFLTCHLEYAEPNTSVGSICKTANTMYRCALLNGWRAIPWVILFGGMISLVFVIVFCVCICGKK